LLTSKVIAFLTYHALICVFTPANTTLVAQKWIAELDCKALPDLNAEAEKCQWTKGRLAVSPVWVNAGLDQRSSPRASRTDCRQVFKLMMDILNMCDKLESWISEHCCLSAIAEGPRDAIISVEILLSAAQLYEKSHLKGLQ